VTRLAAIELENFKGVGLRQRLLLRHITLLFGPNSAGKSTVLQALHYLREILERQNINPDVTIAGGLTNLGGFQTLVHNHDVARAIRIKLEVDVGDEQGADELPLNAGGSFGAAIFEELQLRYLLGESEEHRDYAIVQRVGLEVEVRWSEQASGPYLSKLRIELDGQALASIESPPGEGQAQLTNLNFAHPLVLAVTDPDDSDRSNRTSSPLEDAIRVLSRDVAGDIKRATDEGRASVKLPSGDVRVGIATKSGALPDLTREIVLAIRDPDIKKFELEERTPRVLGLRALLDEMILGPARLVRNCLLKSTYIGPLREVPSRSYRPQVSPDDARWANGLAAWDLLNTDRSGKLLSEVNVWLAGAKRLNTGYEVERVEYREIPVPSRLNQLFERGLNEDDLPDLEELYRSLQSRTEVALRDTGRGIIVSPSDIGVGISQLIPVVVAALRTQEGILAIEQPELHVHPAIQVALGDLLIRAARIEQGGLRTEKTLLAETHSEHLMLRLLRRIRETTDSQVPPGVDPLKPENLSVIYVESNEQAVQFRMLRVDQEGEFIDRWPKGFFEERAEELL
jgi:predicted ATPase